MLSFAFYLENRGESIAAKAEPTIAINATHTKNLLQFILNFFLFLLSLFLDIYLFTSY